MSKVTQVRSSLWSYEVWAGALVVAGVLWRWLSPRYVGDWGAAWLSVAGFAGLVVLIDGFRRACVLDLWIVELDADWLRITRNGAIEFNRPLFDIRQVASAAGRVALIGPGGANFPDRFPEAIFTREQTNRLLELNQKPAAPSPAVS